MDGPQSTTQGKPHEAPGSVRGAAGSTTVQEDIKGAKRYGGWAVYDFIVSVGLGFALGNVVKYIARAGKKDGATALQDLRKAKTYLDKHIETLEAEEAKKHDWDRTCSCLKFLETWNNFLTTGKLSLLDQPLHHVSCTCERCKPTGCVICGFEKK